MRKGGRRDGSFRRGPHWGGLGCAIPVLLFALADVGGLPQAVVVGLGIAAVVTIIVCLRWWSSLAGKVHRRVGRGLHNMLKDAALHAACGACGAVANDLDHMLDRHDPGFRHGVVSEFLHGRHVLTRYHNELREAAADAVNQAREVVSVPPAVVRCAERPRSVADLEYLRDWLRRIAEESAAV
jgi:hypothetical protein